VSPDPPGAPAWATASDPELLSLRLCDLGLRLRGSLLEAPLARLRSELRARGLVFRPHAWLSSEWFTPDGVSGFAVPFSLAHPRLIALERAQLGTVEGERGPECMRLLRHEAGHAFLNAYRLHRRRAWRDAFGRAGTPYRRRWRPDPRSRAHVLHLGGWYAQSHPVEDFCETFAVWLAPGKGWKRRYACWPALEKLKWVEREMQRIAKIPAPVIVRERTEELRTLETPLARHYRSRRRRQAGGEREPEDRALDLLFAAGPRGAPSAAAWLRHRRGALLRAMRARGRDPYTVEQALERWIHRAHARELVAPKTTRGRAERALAAAVRALEAGRDVPELSR